MSSDIFTKTLSNGVRFHAVFDDKYKTEYLNLFFSLPLTPENATMANLASRVIQRGTVSYPTMRDLSRALDDNYSATVGAGAFKCGEAEIFSVNLVSLKERYALGGEKVFSKGVEIVSELLLNPLTENEGFKDEYVESERQNLIDSINSQMNNKASWSKSRFISSMCRGEAFATNSEGDVALAKSISGKELFDFYKNTVICSPCDIFYVGEKDPDAVAELVGDLFDEISRPARPETDVVFEERPLNRACDKMSIAQSHVWIGFRTGITYKSEDYLAMVLFNMVLGGDVTSKMFMNLREKMSLCYTCHSALEPAKGLLLAYAGVDPSNADITEKAFFEQLEKIRSGEITDEEIADAKKSYANRMREIIDDPSLLASWYFIRLSSGAVRDPEKDAQAIFLLSREDVVRMAKRIKLDTIFVLAGGEAK